MIASVIGTIDGVPVIFIESKPNQWEVNVPADLEDGKYTCEITATDTAGNQTFIIAELYSWQNVVTKVVILEQKYKETLLADRVFIECQDGLREAVLPDIFSSVDGGDGFCIKMC